MKTTVTTTTLTCDLCKNEVSELETIKYPVVFITEQTEGRSSEPYIDYKQIDLCEDCMKKSLKIIGMGCQGYNTFELRKGE